MRKKFKTKKKMRHNLILNVCGTVLLLLVTSCMEKTDLLFR